MIGFDAHDHDRCVADTIAAAELYCKEGKLRFTPLRRRVLEILLEQHRALGAYDILDQLREDGMGSQPPVAYRALEFLVAHGFAHKIERLNAFVACSHVGEDHAPAFLICRACDSVVETPSTPVRGALDKAAQSAEFRIEKMVVEAVGLCPKCDATSY